MSVINVGDVNTGAGMSLDATLVEELSVNAESTDDGIQNIPVTPAHCEWVEAHCDPGTPAQCVEGGCTTVTIPAHCEGGQCDECGPLSPDWCGNSCADKGEDHCKGCPCCTWVEEQEICQMCCTLQEAEPPHCVEASCEWIPEDPGSWGTQDALTFEVDALWLQGNIQTGLSVLPKDTQDIEATDHQSWTGAFTFQKTYVVTDNDPVPDEGPAAAPVPIPLVP